MRENCGNDCPSKNIIQKSAFCLDLFEWGLFIKMATDWQVSEVGDTCRAAAVPGRLRSVQIEWSWLSAGTAHLGFPALLSVPHLLSREIKMNRRHFGPDVSKRVPPSDREREELSIDVKHDSARWKLKLRTIINVVSYGYAVLHHMHRPTPYSHLFQDVSSTEVLGCFRGGLSALSLRTWTLSLEPFSVASFAFRKSFLVAIFLVVLPWISYACAVKSDFCCIITCFFMRRETEVRFDSACVVSKHFLGC